MMILQNFWKRLQKNTTSVSDEVRQGLRNLFQEMGKEDPAIADLLRETAQNKLDRCAGEIADLCGPEILS
jgi:hypothetical protein